MRGNGQAIQANLFGGNVASPLPDVSKKRQPKNPCKVLEKNIRKVNGSLVNMVTGNFVCPGCKKDVDDGQIINGKVYHPKCGKNMGVRPRREVEKL